MCHRGSGKPTETVIRSVAARGGWVGREEQAEHGGFGGSEDTPHDTIKVIICLSKAHGIYDTKTKP